MISRILIILSIICTLTSCRMPESFGFHQPITMTLVVPDGPPEFKAGWHSGCSTGLSNKTFSNAFVYGSSAGPDYSNGVYQHDRLFQTGWSQGWFACVLHADQFVAPTHRAFAHSPLT